MIAESLGADGPCPDNRESLAPAIAVEAMAQVEVGTLLGLLPLVGLSFSDLIARLDLEAVSSGL